MISNRIKNNEGIHLIYEKDDIIIGHVNSAAKYKNHLMIGGLATLKQYRHMNIATSMISGLINYYNNEDYNFCVFNNYPEDNSLFTNLGFKNTGTWGIFIKMK